MSNRGKPLPWSVREEIKRLAADMSLSKVARELGVARDTVRKYAGRSLGSFYSHGTEN